MTVLTLALDPLGSKGFTVYDLVTIGGFTAIKAISPLILRIDGGTEIMLNPGEYEFCEDNQLFEAGLAENC